MIAPLLAVRGVKTFYGNIMALKGVDLDVNEGEIVTLIGANGAGKSTLMMTIFGNPRASEGAVIFDGRAHLQVFQDRHARKDATAFGRLRDAEPRDLVGRHLRDVAAVEQDLPRAGAWLAEDRHHQRRLAGAVGADQGDDFA